MNKRSHIHKKADSSASNPVLSQLQSRPKITQAQPQSEKHLTQTQTEDQEFQQQKFEATKLEIQAKYGTITPEGQERLTVLQAQMSGLLHRRLEQASQFSHNFANIPMSRPDAPLQSVVQTKLTIGEPGDKFEIDADEVANEFVKQYHAPVSQQADQNLQPEDMSVEEKELQMKPMLQLRSAKVGMTAAPEVEASIKQARGGGQSMADNIRKPYEQFLGANFRRVKIHTDPRADELNRKVGAVAFTTGIDMFFRSGKYNPGRKSGDELLVHELRHVQQQNGKEVQAKPDIAQRTPDTVIQSKADQIASEEVNLIRSPVSLGQSPQVQRMNNKNEEDEFGDFQSADPTTADQDEIDGVETSQEAISKQEKEIKTDVEQNKYDHALTKAKKLADIDVNIQVKSTDSYKRVIPEGTEEPRGTPSGVTVKTNEGSVIYIHEKNIRKWVLTGDIGNLFSTIRHEAIHVQQNNRNEVDEESIREFPAYAEEIFAVEKLVNSSPKEENMLPSSKHIEESYNSALEHYKKIKAPDNNLRNTYERLTQLNEEKLYENLKEYEKNRNRVQKLISFAEDEYQKYIDDSSQNALYPSTIETELMNLEDQNVSLSEKLNKLMDEAMKKRRS